MLEAIVESLRRRSVQLVVDVSNAQGQVEWGKVAAAGVHGGFAKATEGAHYVDAFHAANRAGSARHQIHLGLYHFARPDLNDPETEADHFARVIGQLHPFELVPALDLEVAGHVGADSPVHWARRFNVRFHHHLGVYPLFYSYGAFIDGLRANSVRVADDGKRTVTFTTPIGGGLWLASYGRNDGQDHSAPVPAPWKKTRLHQFTSNGRVPGVKGHADLSHTSSLPLVGKAAQAR